MVAWLNEIDPEVGDLVSNPSFTFSSCLHQERSFLSLSIIYLALK